MWREPSLSLSAPRLRGLPGAGELVNPAVPEKRRPLHSRHEHLCRGRSRTEPPGPRAEPAPDAASEPDRTAARHEEEEEEERRERRKRRAPLRTRTRFWQK
ncbi:hypothetical protein ANANG_G00070340 [Anguilla anguilla]|uniref:Uncharacterized protein n=1 Tax=Anguilla anguilla TaxID=7936 RepID=A0A9D3S7T4_ANGAN|nr:hypothetical protein ANANG_G00070340 [Anguilla anguilla]